MKQNIDVCLNCPFCGSSWIQFVGEGTNSSGDMSLRVQCQACYVMTKGFHYSMWHDKSEIEAKAQALEAWNTRA